MQLQVVLLQELDGTRQACGGDAAPLEKLCKENPGSELSGCPAWHCCMCSWMCFTPSLTLQTLLGFCFLVLAPPHPSAGAACRAQTQGSPAAAGGDRLCPRELCMWGTEECQAVQG